MARLVSTSYIQSFSTLAGPIQSVKAGMQHGSLRFVKHDLDSRRIYRMWTRVVAYGSLLVVALTAAYLFQPANWVLFKAGTASQRIGDGLMLGCLALLQLFLLAGTYMATRSTLGAKNPVPLRPQKGLRVALATTRAPGEPIRMVKKTLLAAKQVRYAQGTVDVWLLDETRSKALERLCKELDVYYFSRKNVAAWNIMLARRGFFKRVSTSIDDSRLAARTKHGNFNAWGQHLEGDRYDIIAGIDADQVPLPNFLERLLGYFRDPDVAYVVGPQVYANAKPGLQGLVTRWADSQASFFQSTIQRAANASTSGMFVGTNYAVRAAALAQAKGFYPCITEDLATGLAIQSNPNKRTGNHWKAVYTPDVLALGEGPTSWSAYFTQQWRWSAGAFDATSKLFGSVIKNLSAKARMHYILILMFYPIAALTWLLSVASSLLYVATGASAVTVRWNQFMALYLMSTVLQVGAYFWNHRGDVSPFTPPGSLGIPGMIITGLTAPIYLSALIGVLLGKTAIFTVTKKGTTKNPDTLKTFSLHLSWAAILAVGLLYGLAKGHTNAAMLAWLGLQLVVCLTPVVLGMSLVIRKRPQVHITSSWFNPRLQLNHAMRIFNA